MAITYNTALSMAWSKLGLRERRTPTEVFPRVTKKDFEDLKNEYINKHGYVVSIPEISDIVHLTPKEFKNIDEIKAEKRKALMRILASPAPEWAMKYSSIMTILDNYQDATSLIYPAIAMLSRWAPKVMGKVLPILGWMMLVGDLLEFVIGIGRLPLRGMGGKRLNCEVIRHNPFSKKARVSRIWRLRNYKPGIADLLQVAQTTDNVIGVGLSLGPIMGFIQDSIFGLYRYLSGEKVRWSYDVADMFEHEQGGRKAMMMGALINSTGQVFDEETHFWSQVMMALGGRLYLPYCHENDIAGVVEKPMDILIPAPRPTDPITIDVIKEEGLDVEEGIGWPMNKEPQISLSDLTDYISQNLQNGIMGFWRRHEKDWLGYVSSVALDQIWGPSIMAFEPTCEIEWEDPPLSRVVFTMLKAPLLPKRHFTQGEAKEFIDWVNAIYEVTKRPPGLIQIQDKLDMMGIPYQTFYPPEREPEADIYFPKDLEITKYTAY